MNRLISTIVVIFLFQVQSTYAQCTNKNGIAISKADFNGQRVYLISEVYCIQNSEDTVKAELNTKLIEVAIKDSLSLTGEIEYLIEDCTDYDCTPKYHYGGNITVEVRTEEGIHYTASAEICCNASSLIGAKQDLLNTLAFNYKIARIKGAYFTSIPEFNIEICK